MPKAWQNYVTTSWFSNTYSTILYIHFNTLGFKIQPMIRMNSVYFITLVFKFTNGDQGK